MGLSVTSLNRLLQACIAAEIRESQFTWWKLYWYTNDWGTPQKKHQAQPMYVGIVQVCYSSASNKDQMHPTRDRIEYALSTGNCGGRKRGQERKYRNGGHSAINIWLINTIYEIFHRTTRWGQCFFCESDAGSFLLNVRTANTGKQRRKAVETSETTEFIAICIFLNCTVLLFTFLHSFVCLWSCRFVTKVGHQVLLASELCGSG